MKLSFLSEYSFAFFLLTFLHIINISFDLRKVYHALSYKDEAYKNSTLLHFLIDTVEIPKERKKYPMAFNFIFILDHVFGQEAEGQRAQLPYE